MKYGSASAPMLNAIVILPDDDEALLVLVLVLGLVVVLVLVELEELLQPARTAIDAHASRAIAPRAPADLVRR
jgi:hypothetical protein